MDCEFGLLDQIPRARVAGVITRLRAGQSFKVAVLSEGLDRDDRSKLMRLADSIGSTTPPAFIAAVLEEIYARAALAPVSPEVVWTGPRVEGIGCTYTPTVVAARSIVDGASGRIIVAGYRITAPALDRLGIWSAVERGVQIDAIMNDKDVDELDYQVMVSKGIRVHRAAPAAKDFAKFHVKAIVGDDSSALVGSANFTAFGQTSNIEMGLWVTGTVAATIQAMLDKYLEAARSTGWLITS